MPGTVVDRSAELQGSDEMSGVAFDRIAKSQFTEAPAKLEDPRVAQLERELEEAQAKLEARRIVDRERGRRWRANHREEARLQSRESMRRFRARKRQAGGPDTPQVGDTE